MNILNTAKSYGVFVTAITVIIGLPVIAAILTAVIGLFGALFLLGLDLSGFYPVEIGIMNSIGTGIVILMAKFTIQGTKSND